MQPYELDKEAILLWATEYAGYDELEEIAKGLYALYAERRKAEKPEAHKRAKVYKKKYKARRV